MPYVEQIYKGEADGERYYTPESAMKRMKRENDCGTCAYSHMNRGKVEACHRQDEGLDCRYREREIRTCPTCGKEVYRDEMQYTKDCHGIPFRLVCWECCTRLMAEGYDGEYYDEADEQIDDDY